MIEVNRSLLKMVFLLRLVALAFAALSQILKASEFAPSRDLLKLSEYFEDEDRLHFEIIVGVHVWSK